MAEIIKYLLLFDPNGSARVHDTNQMYHLHVACEEYGVNLNTVKLLFDVYPNAIYEMENSRALPVTLAMNRGDARGKYIAEYLTDQLNVIHRVTACTSAQLPLHRALHENVSLGAIKLIMKDYPAPIHTSNDDGVFPLHIACEHTSVDIVKYLIDQDDS